MVLFGDRTNNFQDTRVDCIPEGCSLLLNIVVNGPKVPEFTIQVQLQFLSCLRAFKFGCV